MELLGLNFCGVCLFVAMIILSLQPVLGTQCFLLDLSLHVAEKIPENRDFVWNLKKTFHIPEGCTLPAVPGDSFSLDFLLLSYEEVFTFYENSLLEHLFCVSLKSNNWASVAFLWKLSELCSLSIPHKQRKILLLLSTCSQKVKTRIIRCLLLVLKLQICPRISNRE